MDFETYRKACIPSLSEKVSLRIVFPSLDSLRVSSEVLQRYSAYKLETLHFSFRSTIELVKLAALLYRAYNEKSLGVWLSPWQRRALWLALYREHKEYWFVASQAENIFSMRPDWSLKYPVKGIKL